MVLLKCEKETYFQKYSADELELLNAVFGYAASLSRAEVPHVPQWFIPPHEVDFAETPFSKGAFGSVHHGTWLDARVVVKRMLNPVDNELDRGVFMNEIKIWYYLNFPHVVKLHGACHVGRPFFVCEFASNGILTDFLAREEREGRHVLWQKLYEVALGLHFLHERNVTHGDLKGNNILVSADGLAKLTDFGLTDIYSFGMSIIEAATHALPWGNQMPDSATTPNCKKIQQGEEGMTSCHVPFRDLELTVEEEQHCHDRAFQLLDRTLRSYDERDGQGEGRPTAPRHHSELDNTQWKLLKTQNDASMYIKRNNRAQRDLNLLDGGWENPVTVLVVGTIRGDLDEVMLGIETPDFASFKTRSEIYTKQAVDGAVLSKLSSSTEDDPFRYMGIQWLMFEHHWPLSVMVHPRDFVSLASVGTMTRTNGERIGYEVVLPANLSRYPPLPKPFVRAKMMYTVIFKQLEPGIVDIYLHTYVETQSFILDKLVVSGIWRSNLGFWGSTQLAELKKLQWCITHCRDRGLQRLHIREFGSSWSNVLHEDEHC
ncbi:hypothetical protein BBP00_00004675 [Phytophthora kernoviae]|uniref:Protein kinase domain-containing protein n=1 Tax=Phytophthora kernoviae TaxID=325452 RepID=A0A3F2RR22_9STRA|nr:hypothetical protein BBP00_00004675 [Phytophthora kernoviae]